MTLIRGRRPVLPARTYQGAAIDLTDFAQHVRPGDRLYMEVRAVVSTPAGGQPKTDRFTSAEPIALN